MSRAACRHPEGDPVPHEALELDDGYREAVDEDHDIWDPVVPIVMDGDLVDCVPVIGSRSSLAISRTAIVRVSPPSRCSILIPSVSISWKVRLVRTSLGSSPSLLRNRRLAS